MVAKTAVWTLSPALATLPSRIETTPTRPVIGALIVYQPSWTLRLSIAAWSPSRARFAGRDRGPGVVEIDLRRSGARDEIRIAGDVALRLLELRRVLGELGLGAFELGDGLPRIELDQRVAGLDLRAVGDQHLVDGGVEMRAQRDRRHRLGDADLLDPPGHVLAHDCGDHDRDRRALGRGSPDGGSGRGCGRAPESRGQMVVRFMGERPQQRPQRRRQLVDAVGNDGAEARQDEGDRRDASDKPTKSHDPQSPRKDAADARPPRRPLGPIREVRLTSEVKRAFHWRDRPAVAKGCGF